MSGEIEEIINVIKDFIEFFRFLSGRTGMYKKHEEFDGIKRIYYRHGNGWFPLVEYLDWDFGGIIREIYEWPFLDIVIKKMTPNQEMGYYGPTGCHKEFDTIFEATDGDTVCVNAHPRQPKKLPPW